MVEHLKVEHSGHVPLVCSATLVKKSSSGSGYVECPVLVRCAGNLDCLPSSSAAAATSSRGKTSRRKRAISSSDEDDDEICERKTARRKVQKGSKTGKQ